MAMESKKCPNCKDGILKSARKKYNFGYMGESIPIDSAEFWVCGICGEEVITYDEVKKMENIAKKKTNVYSGRYVLKIPPDIHIALDLASKRNQRSLNQEIINRLKESMARE